MPCQMKILRVNNDKNNTHATCKKNEYIDYQQLAIFVHM